MAEVRVNRMTNANVYMDGASFLGRASEVELPKITQKMAEHVALGMIGSFELPSGIEKMEGKINWNSFYNEAIIKMGNPGAAINFQVRGNLETWNSTGKTGEVPAVVFMTGTFKELPLGNFKQHENVELESMINVTSVRMEIDGSELIYIDVFSNTYKVNGIDIASTYRENIGQ